MKIVELIQNPDNLSLKKPRSIDEQQVQLQQTHQMVQKVESMLVKEHKKYKDYFEYPPNPALIAQKSRYKNVPLQRLNDYFLSNGLQSTKLQLQVSNRKKRTIEYEFWRDGIERTLQGYSESEFDDLFCKFVNQLSFSHMNDMEKKVLFSHSLQYSQISAKAQKYIQNWLKSNKFSELQNEEQSQQNEKTLQQLSNLEDQVICLKSIESFDSESNDEDQLTKLTNKKITPEIMKQISSMLSDSDSAEEKLFVNIENKIEKVEIRAIYLIRKINLLEQDFKQNQNAFFLLKLQKQQKKLKQKLHRLKKYRKKLKLIEDHRFKMETVKEALGQLDQQTDSITQGDIRHVTTVTYKFDPKGQVQTVKPKQKLSIEESGYPYDSPSHSVLLKECFDRHNQPIANMIHTSEKIKRRSISFQNKLDRMLDRVFLDRNLLIKEKIQVILGSK